MKKISCLIIILFIFNTGFAQISKATLTASGLTCSMCSKAIYNALQKLKGVESVKANISESSYDIVLKSNSNTTPDEIRKAVEDAGFSVAKLQLTISFDNVAVKNNTHIAVAGGNLHFLNVKPQTLNGEAVLTLVDKNFVPVKDYKKYAQYTTMKCFETGKIESCCTKDGEGQRVYHVTI